MAKTFRGLPSFVRGTWPYLKPAFPWFLGGVACGLVAGFCNLAQALAMRGLIDGASKGETAKIAVLVASIGGITVVWMSTKFIWAGCNGALRSRMIRNMNAALAGRMMTVRVDELEKRHSGDLLSRFANDMKTLEGFIGGGLPMLAYTWTLFIGALAFTLSFNWKLALACQILTPIMAVASRKVGAPLKELNAAYHASLAEANAIGHDVVGGMPIVKAFGLAGPLGLQFQAAADEALKDALRLDKRNALMVPMYLLSRQASMIICALLGCWFAIRGGMDAGTLAIFGMLIGYVIGPAYDLPRLLAEYKSASGAGERVLEALGLPEERTDGERFIPSGEAALAFRAVSFSYAEGNPVLSGVSFEALRGKTLAIVGPSGSGKSTILSLVCAFRSPDSGNIELFGRPLDAWNLEAARRTIALVTQEALLLPDTIAENIRAGKAGASDAEVEAAAKAANAHDFIMASPAGYATIVGERGVSLSGGQRQRVALARAILKDAEILILDEPTSALDAASERLVQDAIEAMMGERTVIIVAHRMSTIRKADSAIVLAEGRIVERGRHEELLARGGLYAKLYGAGIDAEAPR